ncbi:MAG: aminoglycoside phosphotransferase family protein [Vicinamibacterales bacterium]|nr:aminoglycoside phosphotransferase family protein [Vicinamibacterales bacterium]
MDLSWLGKQLEIDGEFISAVAYGSGHINETFVATYEMRAVGKGTETRQCRFIHQRINTNIFKDPATLMCNLARVTKHIRGKLEAQGEDDLERRVLTLISTRDNIDWVIDERGNYWRTFQFIEGATTFDVVETVDQAREVGHAFGEFQGQLIDLGPPQLAFTIPDFHNTRERLRAFQEAVERDVCNRAASVRDEISRVDHYVDLVDDLLKLQRAGEIPLRVVHNDTKINNVLIDDETGKGLCVIDLDTVMPGLVADDFGDLIRTSSSFAREDERDLSKVVVELPIFEALVIGYLSASGSFLTDSEVDSLIVGSKLMTYEQALRFLADHLTGDTYFRIHREAHNLDRARVQIALLDSIVAHEDEMRSIIELAVKESQGNDATGSVPDTYRG